MLTIICGLKDRVLAEKLLAIPDLTLNNCIVKVRAAETAKCDIDTIKSAEANRPTIKSEVDIVEKKNCKYCTGWHKPRECPAFSRECVNCGGRGHYKASVYCPKNPNYKKPRNPQSARQQSAAPQAARQQSSARPSSRSAGFRPRNRNLQGNAQFVEQAQDTDEEEEDQFLRCIDCTPGGGDHGQ